MKHEHDIRLSFDELCQACASEPRWLLSLVEENVLAVDNADGDVRAASFSGWHLTRVRRAQRLSRDFDASVPAVALILELLDEVEQLRRQVPTNVSHSPMNVEFEELS